MTLHTNSRGFVIFAERTRPEDEIIFGNEGTVRVLESSLAGKGPYVWIFAPGDQSVELSLKEAEVVHTALGKFIQAAYADRLTESPPLSRR